MNMVSNGPLTSDSCFTRYDPHTMRMDVLAYNDIKKGEELSISCERTQAPPLLHRANADQP